MDVGELNVVIVPVPDMSDQVPVPMIGVFAAKVVLSEQIVWSNPAFALVGGGSTIIATVSREVAQGRLVILHLKVFTPTLNPVTVDVGLFGEVIVPEPVRSDHVPIPTRGLFPANVVVDVQMI